MLNDIQITPIQESDVDTLSRIARQAYAEHYADTWLDNGVWYMHQFLSSNALQNELADASARFYFISFQQEIVGFLKLNLQKRIGEHLQALELERIYLLQKVVGKGIGSFVLQWVDAFARSTGHKVVWLKAMDTNPAAIAFYEKAGFVICGTHEVNFPLKKNGMRGMFVMQKLLRVGTAANN